MTTLRAIAPIATLPVFFKLGGRRVVVAGGTPPAVWKAELMAAAGADVLVLSAEPYAEMVALAAELPERLRLEPREWTLADLGGAALAIGAFADESAGAAFRDAARSAGVPVNVIDVPPLCDFQFGTIVERSPLVIGISTDGAAPVLGQALRARIEALLPARMGQWMQAAKAWRIPLQAMRLGFAARRCFWETFADLALSGENRTPNEADRLACETAALDAKHHPAGKILLVGAGSGPVDLLTLQAVKALQSADAIVYDTGIDPAILELARREAARQPWTRASTLAGLEAARTGKTIAWMAPGDPETCAEWVLRRRDLEATELPVRLVKGLACAACECGRGVPGAAELQ